MLRLLARFLLTRLLWPREVYCRGSEGCDLCTSALLKYRCVGCARMVPWCYGAADDRWQVCDACWCLPVTACA